MSAAIDMIAMAVAFARYVDRCQWNGDCLESPGEAKGYGTVYVPGSKDLGAHRACFIVHHGPIPAGLVVRHTCDNRKCLNPSHLRVGTHKDNERDKWERGRGPVGLDWPQATVPAEVIRDAVAEYLRGGVTQKIMADRLGVTTCTFSSWVRGKHRKDSGVIGVTFAPGWRPGVEPKPCGTNAAWFRHRSRGEEPCNACVEAKRAYWQAWKQKRDAARGDVA